MGRWLIAIGVAFFAADAAAGCWLDVAIGSRHSDRGAGYNEHNYGLGVDCQVAKDWSAVAGQYKNSLNRDTIYAGADYTYARAWGVEFGLRTVIATGYDDNPIPLPPIPVAKIRGKSWGLGLLFVPPVTDKHWVVGYWLSFAF